MTSLGTRGATPSSAWISSLERMDGLPCSACMTSPEARGDCEADRTKHKQQAISRQATGGTSHLRAAYRGRPPREVFHAQMELSEAGNLVGLWDRNSNTMPKTSCPRDSAMLAQPSATTSANYPGIWTCDR